MNATHPNRPPDDAAFADDELTGDDEFAGDDEFRGDDEFGGDGYVDDAFDEGTDDAHGGHPGSEPAEAPRPSLAQSVTWAVEQYFEDLDGEPPKDLYALFVDILEKPLLQTVVVKARGNQCRAADWLGLNRNTLARKLQQHGMDAKAMWFQARLEQRRRGG